MTTTLLDLPDELLLRILAHFDVVQLSRRICRVCTRLRVLAYDSSLWHTLDFKAIRAQYGFSVTSTETLRGLAGRIGSLRLLSVDQASALPLNTCIAACKTIKVLRLTFASIPDAVLVSALQRFQLEELDLEGNDGLTDSLFVSESINPVRFASIARLNLAHCRSITDATIFAITEHCTNLHHLNVDGVRYATVASLRHLVRTRGAGLRTLIIDGADTDDTVPVSIGDAATGLRELSSSFCEEWTDAGLDALSSLTQLQSLRLRKGFLFSSAGLLQYFTQSTLSSLTKLDLTECAQLTDESVQQIAFKCPLLKFINLSWCWYVGDTGVKDLVRQCRHLLVMDLTGLKSLSDASLEGLKEEDRLPLLRVLNVKQCNYVTDPALLAISNARPHMIIVDYYGQAVNRPETDLGYFGHTVLDDGSVVSLG